MNGRVAPSRSTALVCLLKESGQAQRRKATSSGTFLNHWSFNQAGFARAGTLAALGQARAFEHEESGTLNFLAGWSIISFAEFGDTRGSRLEENNGLTGLLLLGLGLAHFCFSVCFELETTNERRMVGPAVQRLPTDR